MPQVPKSYVVFKKRNTSIQRHNKARSNPQKAFKIFIYVSSLFLCWCTLLLCTGFSKKKCWSLGICETLNKGRSSRSWGSGTSVAKTRHGERRMRGCTFDWVFKVNNRFLLARFGSLVHPIFTRFKRFFPKFFRPLIFMAKPNSRHSRFTVQSVESIGSIRFSKHRFH